MIYVILQKARPYIRTRRGRLEHVKGYAGRPSKIRTVREGAPSRLKLDKDEKFYYHYSPIAGSGKIESSGILKKNSFVTSSLEQAKAFLASAGRGQGEIFRVAVKNTNIQDDKDWIDFIKKKGSGYWQGLINLSYASYLIALDDLGIKAKGSDLKQLKDADVIKLEKISIKDRNRIEKIGKNLGLMGINSINAVGKNLLDKVNEKS